MADEEPPHKPTRRNWVSFWSLMGLQGQNAFNDKALQFTLVPLGFWIAASQSAAWGGKLPHLLGLLILLPFILFAPLSGWASDRFSKTRVIRLTAWMQLAVLLVVLYALYEQNLPLAVACFFFLAVQSTILSPAKNGIIKELLGSQHLGFASGMMQMLTILAILAGQILIGFWFTARQVSAEAAEETAKAAALAAGAAFESEAGWIAGLFPLLVITLGAVVTLVLAYSIQVMPAQSKRPFKASLIVSHFKQLGLIFHSAPLRLSALGIAYFWAFGTIMQFITLEIVADNYVTDVDGQSVMDAQFARANSYMMLAASGGIALGSVLGAMINKRHIELGLTPVGGLVMLTSCILLVFAVPETAFFYVSLSALGLGVAFFFVPLNAFLQDKCDPEQRGNILAGSALLNCLAMVLAVGAQLAMKDRVPPSIQFLLLGLTAVFVTWYVMRLLPRAFVKLLTLSALRAIYRIEALNVERMPEKGGVLLTPNHISYLDALMLTAASPRPVRFLMVHHYFNIPLVGRFARLFDTVPISTTRAKDAVKIASRAVEEGSVVCIFPEGQLSRSGFMSEVKRGFELIARKADCVVQPVYLDGLWKSVFSAEGGKFFWKRPRSFPFGVRVAFGEPRGARECSATVVKRDLNALAGSAMARRRRAVSDLPSFLERRSKSARALAWWQDGRLQTCRWSDVRRVIEGETDPADLARGHEGAAGWLSAWQSFGDQPAEEVRGLILNAIQLADVGTLGSGKSPVLLDATAPLTVRRVWGMLLPVLTRTYAVALGPDGDAAVLQGLRDAKVDLRTLVGTDSWRELIATGSAAGTDACLFRFGGEAQTAVEAGEGTLACHEAGGRIVSVSLPHAPMIRKNDLEQVGWKEGSFGRLLTGFVPGEEGGVLKLEGEMIESAIELPGWTVDELGFLTPGPGARTDSSAGE